MWTKIGVSTLWVVLALWVGFLFGIIFPAPLNTLLGFTAGLGCGIKAAEPWLQGD